MTATWAPTTKGVCGHCGRKGRFYRAQPGGYVAWFDWAERIGKTHEQHPCPGCGRMSVWKPK